MPRRVLTTLLVAYALAAGAAGWASGSLLWGLVLVPLAMAVGPAMGLTFPFPLGTKLAYVGGLLLVVVLGLVGLRWRARPVGGAAIVTAVVLWAVLGLFGLGTGT